MKLNLVQKTHSVRFLDHRLFNSYLSLYQVDLALDVDMELCQSQLWNMFECSTCRGQSLSLTLTFTASVH